MMEIHPFDYTRGNNDMKNKYKNFNYFIPEFLNPRRK